MESAETVVQSIVSKTRLGESEVLALIESKKKKFSGMLTDAGAAFMVAKELNVSIGLEKRFSSVTPIAQLRDGMKQVDVRADILQVLPPKPFEKNGRKGELQNVLLGDDSGIVRLTLWGQDVQSLQQQKIEKGTRLMLQNCSVSAFKEQLQLQLNYNGIATVESQPKPSATRLGDLKEGMKSVDVYARLQSVFPTQPFEKEGKRGLRARMLLGDGKTTIPAIAWNESVQQVQRVQPNTVVKIENAYTKSGLSGEVELHLGFNARVIPNPHNAPSIESSATVAAPEKRISGIQPNEYCALNGTVLQLDRLSTYNTCDNCGNRVDESAGTAYCPTCDAEVKAVPRMAANVLLDDGSGTIGVVLFGETAEQAIGLTATEWENKRLEKDPLKELQERVVGKRWKLTGKARENDYSGELEFSARRAEGME